jgi:hypothetical protein
VNASDVVTAVRTPPRPLLDGGRRGHIHPRAGHPIAGGDLSRAAALHDDGSDHQARFGHPPTSRSTDSSIADRVRDDARHPSGMF